MQSVEVRLTARRGRGVFALRAFSPGECIEAAPVLLVPAVESEHVARTVFDSYVYHWPDGALALVLGFGSLYNHSYTPNARFNRDVDHAVMRYTALRTIEAGEEILINYNGDPDCRDPLWFDAAD